MADAERERQIAERFCEGREDARLSQGALSHELQLTRDQIANIETGRSVLSWKVGRSYCEFLNISQRWLATGEEPVYPYVRVGFGGIPIDLERFTASGLFSEVYDTLLAQECDEFFAGGLEHVKRQLRLISFARPLGQHGPGTVQEESAILARVVRGLIEHLVRVLPPALYGRLFDTIRNACTVFVEENAAEIVKGNKAIGRDTKAAVRAIDMDAARPDESSLAAAVGVPMEKGLTNISQYPITPPMPTWAELKTEVQRFTKERGAKAALARHCGVTPQAVASWLDEESETQPGAEAAFRLLEWASVEKAKRSTPVAAKISKPSKSRKTR